MSVENTMIAHFLMDLPLSWDQENHDIKIKTKIFSWGNKAICNIHPKQNIKPVYGFSVNYAQLLWTPSHAIKYSYCNLK